jgi:alkylhydroperoxidase family enzyme
MAKIKLIQGFEGGVLGGLAHIAARWIVGKQMKPVGIYAHNPRFLLAYNGMAQFVEAPSKLSPELRKLAMQLTAELNGCEWCKDFGRYQGQKKKIDSGKLSRVLHYHSDAAFSSTERVALAYVEAMNIPGAKVPEAVFAELKCHFSDREIVELTVAVAAEGFFNKVNGALGVEAQGLAQQ